MKKRLMMLGPPGAGKGTQAQRICEDLGIPQVSTGDMLRSARRKGTELGKKAGEFMDAGDLVPDSVVIGIVKERLSEDDAADGFILDGFPRTVEQASALDEMGIVLDAVLNIIVDDEVVVERLGGRISCKSCGATFHKIYSPPAEEGVCDRCGESALYQREDDQAEAIRQRLASYASKTAPLIGYYRERDRLVDVDGTGDPAEVEKRVRQAVT